MFIKRFLNFTLNKGNKKTIRKFTVGTPIIVIDTITNESIKFLSISEAARYFNTYPKTI